MSKALAAAVELFVLSSLNVTIFRPNVSVVCCIDDRSIFPGSDGRMQVTARKAKRHLSRIALYVLPSGSTGIKSIGAYIDLSLSLPGTIFLIARIMLRCRAHALSVLCVEIPIVEGRLRF